MTRTRAVRILAVLAVWVVIAVPAWALLFLHHHRAMVLGGHDVVLTPTFGRYAVLEMGPYIPDIRIRTGGRVGVAITVDKTLATSTGQLIDRYALMASRPEPEIRRVVTELRSMALEDAVRAGLIGLVPLGLWMLVGAERRHQLRHPSRRTASVGGVVLVLVAVVAWEPWQSGPEHSQSSRWIPLQSALPGIPVPAELQGVQVAGGLFTKQTEHLARSALRVFAESKSYYGAIADNVAAVASRLHVPGEDETAGLLISDRHDNIGMDQVAAAIAHAAGVTVIIDAGDDTSSGAPWESFSLESLDDAFHDFPTRLFVAGNHDHGGFVTSYLVKAGWTHLGPHASTPFSDVRMLGVDDPRANGLVDPDNTQQAAFPAATAALSDEICKDNDDAERIATVVVHSAAMALPALERGCTDLVIAGHLHRQVGPDRIVGTNDAVGYRYTNGTTGGATFSFALGAKLQRDAEVSVLTWRAGRPVGIQPVVVTTTGDIEVRPYIPLDLGS